MARKLRWLWTAPAFLAIVAVSCGPAGAADQPKVNEATKQVERGAKQIG